MCLQRKERQQKNTERERERERKKQLGYRIDLIIGALEEYSQ
jgi:hypothetical protein